MQRAVVALFEGRIHDAFMLNPVVWILMPYLIAWTVCGFSKKARATEAGKAIISDRAIAIVGVMLLAWGIVRNII